MISFCIQTRVCCCTLCPRRHVHLLADSLCEGLGILDKTSGTYSSKFESIIGIFISIEYKIIGFLIITKDL